MTKRWNFAIIIVESQKHFSGDQFFYSFRNDPAGEDVDDSVKGLTDARQVREEPAERVM